MKIVVDCGNGVAGDFAPDLYRRLGCEVSDLGIVPDRRDLTLAALKTAADHHDLILTSGGVSVGEEDHVKPAVQALGALDLWQISMKPGKPFAYLQNPKGGTKAIMYNASEVMQVMKQSRPEFPPEAPDPAKVRAFAKASDDWMIWASAGFVALMGLFGAVTSKQQ